MADRFALPAPAPSEPTTPTENPQRGFEHPSRFNLWRLGSCSIRRQQVAADAPATKMSWGTASNFPITKNLEALIYGRQIRAAPAAACACRLSLPAAKGTRRACDACLMPALRGLGGSKWNRALPGPYPF